MKRLLWLSSLLVAVLAIAAIVSIPFHIPAVAAYVCPACYGLEKISDGVYVERTMSVADRQQLEQLVHAAKGKIAAFYRGVRSAPTLLVCQSAECDRRTGGRGTLGETFLSVFIRVSPHGINQTILAHELSHAELHARVGAWNFLRGALPPWIDEGIAVIASEDERYLNPNVIGTAKCQVQPGEESYLNHFEWRRTAAEASFLYAQAACRVLRWMDAKGGKDHVLLAIADIMKGMSPPTVAAAAKPTQPD